MRQNNIYRRAFFALFFDNRTADYRSVHYYLSGIFLREKEFHGVIFRENDKVMQVKKNYQIKWVKKNRFGDVYEEGTGVFNGDTGIIKEIVEYQEIVTVEFEEGKLVDYDFSEMDDMELAYAITIHIKKFYQICW